MIDVVGVYGSSTLGTFPNQWMVSGLLWAKVGFRKVRVHEGLPRLAQFL